MYQAYSSVKVIDDEHERLGEAGRVLRCAGSEPSAQVEVKMDMDQEVLVFKLNQLQQL